MFGQAVKFENGLKMSTFKLRCAYLSLCDLFFSWSKQDQSSSRYPDYSQSFWQMKQKQEGKQADKQHMVKVCF